MCMLFTFRFILNFFQESTHNCEETGFMKDMRLMMGKLYLKDQPKS